MKEKLMYAFLAASLLVPSACKSSPPFPEPENDPRLLNTLNKLKSGRTISVVAIGGSITTGYFANPADAKGWAGLVNSWFQKKAGETGGEVLFHNSGAGGTDSSYGSMRVPFHALAYEPDIVIVEFAINDQWLDTKVRKRSYEGVLRQLLKDSGRSVIILSLITRDIPSPDTHKEQKEFAEYYKLPVLNWKDWVNSSEWEQYFGPGDGIHPIDMGHAAIADGITAYLDAAWNNLPSGQLGVETALPAPLVSAEFQTVTFFDANNAEALNLDKSGWKLQDAILPDEWLKRGGVPLYGWTTSDPNADLSIRVKGKSVGVLFGERDTFGNASVWLEDPAGKKTFSRVNINNFVSYRDTYYGYAYAEIADNLDADSEYILHFGMGSGGIQGGPACITGIICTSK